MTESAIITMRVEREVKASAVSIFSSPGMTLTEAINVFLHKSVVEGGLPFGVREPRYNADTEGPWPRLATSCPTRCERRPTTPSMTCSQRSTYERLILVPSRTGTYADLFDE